MLADIAVTFAAPVAHTRRPVQPQSLRCAAVTETTVTWAWDAAVRAHEYWVRAPYSGVPDANAWKRAGGQDQRTHVSAGWTPSTNRNANWRFLDVRAQNNIGSSNANYGSCRSLPANWLTATCASTGQIEANWTIPKDLEGTTGVGYTATATARLPHGYGGTSLDLYNGTATTHTFSGEPGTTYTIRVQTQPIEGKPLYSETTPVECELPACSQDGALLGRAGMTNHRHESDDCHIHESSVPSCSVSEDRAYTVHTDTTVGGEPTHREGVVLACHPGRDQGVVSPQPLSVECTGEGKVVANWAWPSNTDGIRRITAATERFEIAGDLTHLSRWSLTSDQYSDDLLSHTWDNAAPSATYSIKARMIWAREGQLPINGPWTVNQTTTCPPRFPPTNVSAECNNNHGLIGVFWDKVDGADKYRINGPVKLVGGDGYIEVSTQADAPQSTRRTFTLQGEEAKAFSDISVQTFMNGQWSASSETTATKCPKPLAYQPFLGFKWDRISRECVIQSDENGNHTKTRVCTETFNEVLKLDIGGVYGWRRLPLIEWDSDDSIFENISANLGDDSTIGDLASLASGPTWGLLFSLARSQKKMLLFMNPLNDDGGIEATLFPTVDAVRKEALELNGIDLSNVPDSAIELCLPDAGYTVAVPRMPTRPTTTYSGYTTHHETVIYHCTGETTEGQD